MRAESLVHLAEAELRAASSAQEAAAVRIAVHLDEQAR